MVLQERVSEAVRIAHMQMKEESKGKREYKDREKKGDDEESAMAKEGGKKQKRARK